MWHVLNLESVSDLDNAEAIYIYGSARQALRVFEALTDTNRGHFRAFVDSKQSGECRGYPVLDLAQLKSVYGPNDEIVIASSSVHEISIALCAIGVSRVYDSNRWLHTTEARERALLIAGGVPLRNGIPVGGVEGACLKIVQAFCDSLDFEGASASLLRPCNDISSSLSLSMLAYIRFAQNRCAEALDCCEAVLALEPSNWTALERMGCVYLYLRRYEDVMSTSKRLLKLDRDCISAVINFRNALLRLGLLSEVGERLQQLNADVSPRCKGAINYLTTLASYVQNQLYDKKTLPPQLRISARGHKRFVVSVTVFGAESIADLLDSALPSLLASGNVDSWAEQTDSMFLLFTDSAGLEQITSSAVFHELAKLIACRFLVFPGALTVYPTELRYQLLNANNIIGLGIAKANDAGVVFLAPDLVFSTDFFRSVLKQVADGKDALFYSFLPLSKSKFRRRHEIKRARHGTHLSVEPHVLKYIAQSIGFCIDSQVYRDGGVMNLWPYRVCWLAPGHGIVSRAFIAHPLLMTSDALAGYDGQYFSSNDSDFSEYLERADVSFERCSFLDDTVMSVAYELVNPSQTPQLTPTTPPMVDHAKIAAFGISWGRLHRWLFAKEIVNATLPGIELSSALEESEHVAFDVGARMDRYHERYGMRDYIAGYSPFLHVGFPQFPVDV